MRDCTQDTSYPADFSTKSESVARYHTLSAQEAHAQLAHALADTAVRTWALAPTAVDNEPAKVGSGDPHTLARDGKLGTSAPLWAVVIRPNPQLLVFDLDGCADLVIPPLLDAAADTGTHVIAVAKSGRANHAHLWLAPPTSHAREYITRMAGRIRDAHHLAPKAVDDRTGQSIRVPGSPSFKTATAPSKLVDPESGKQVSAHTVLDQLHHAGLLPRADGADSGCSPIQPRHTSRAKRNAHRAPTRPHRRSRDTAPPPRWPLAVVSDDTANGHFTFSPEAPRAWRKRVPFTSSEWLILKDTANPDRSAAATAAAWVLWRHGIRGSRAALYWYRHCPAFSKFYERDLRDGQGTWKACRHHWRSIKERARAHRPRLAAADTDLLEKARQEIGWWTDAPLIHAAATVVLTHRFMDGHGIAGRPIARRDLQMWLHLSDALATRVLRELVERGLLERVQPWDPAAPRQAARYTLRVPGPSFRGDRHHDLTIPTASHQHPLWASLSHTHRTAWELLTHAHSTQALSSLLHLPPGDPSYGTLRILHQLRELGLIEAIGGRRHRQWVRSTSTTLDQAAEETGAVRRATELAVRINGERAAWHAESSEESVRARRGLEVLRKRFVHAYDESDARGALPEMQRWTRGRARSSDPSEGHREPQTGVAAGSRVHSARIVAERRSEADVSGVRAHASRAELGAHPTSCAIGVGVAAHHSRARPGALTMADFRSGGVGVTARDSLA